MATESTSAWVSASSRSPAMGRRRSAIRATPAKKYSAQMNDQFLRSLDAKHDAHDDELAGKEQSACDQQAIQVHQSDHPPRRGRSGAMPDSRARMTVVSPLLE